MRKLIEGSNRNDRIKGSHNDDEIYGFGGNDKLVGKPGDDYIAGGKGSDTIFGGQHFDTLAGGKGNDKFGFNSLLEVDADLILDFKAGADRIILDHHVFSEYRSKGPIPTDNFVLGIEALDDNDHLIYDDTTGQLHYDEDGNGGTEQILLATLDNLAALRATDIFIF
jgi:Ca2+-binding RTX toxin-like protein